MKTGLYTMFLILFIVSCDYLGETKTIDISEVSEEEETENYTQFVDEEWIIRALNYQKGDSLSLLISDFTQPHTQDMVSSPDSGAYNISFNFEEIDLDANEPKEYILEITYSDSSESGYKWNNNKRIAIIAKKNNKNEIIFDNNYKTETSIDDFGLFKESSGHYLIHIREATGARKLSEATIMGNHSFFRIIDGKSEKVLELLGHSTIDNSYLDHDFNLQDFNFKNDQLYVRYKYSFYMHSSEITGLESDTTRFVLLESDEIVRYEWNEANSKYSIHSAETLDEEKIDFFYKAIYDLSLIQI